MQWYDSGQQRPVLYRQGKVAARAAKVIPDDILGEQSQGTVSVPLRQKEDSQLPEERESGSLKTRKTEGGKCCEVTGKESIFGF